MKHLFLFLIIFSVKAFSAPFVFQLKNPAMSDSSLLLGSVDPRLCQSPYLIAMGSMGEGINSATCESVRTPYNMKIKLFIPIKIEVSSSQLIDITFTKDSGPNSFELFSLRSLRNDQSGGGFEILGTTISLNNQSINAELEIVALVGGAGTKSSYTNTIMIDLAPAP